MINKAVYTTPVADSWAGAVMSNELGRSSNELGRSSNDLGRKTGIFLSMDNGQGHAQIQTFLPLKCPKMQKKSKV